MQIRDSNLGHAPHYPGRVVRIARDEIAETNVLESIVYLHARLSAAACCVLQTTPAGREPIFPVTASDGWMSSSASAKIELPRAFELADIDHLVILIADMISRLIAHNDQIPLSPEALTRFHSRSPPAISVLDYLRRIVKYANVEVCISFILFLLWSLVTD